MSTSMKCGGQIRKYIGAQMHRLCYPQEIRWNKKYRMHFKLHIYEAEVIKTMNKSVEECSYRTMMCA